MKAFLTLAESAAFHPDQTFSLLNGGITEFAGPVGTLIPFKMAVVVQLRWESGDHGEHRFEVDLITADSAASDVSQTKLLGLEGEVAYEPGSSGANLIVDLIGAFPNPGRYAFRVRVDENVLDTQEVNARQIQVPEGAETMRR